mgnify:CR=1 FL=1
MADCVAHHADAFVTVHVPPARSVEKLRALTTAALPLPKFPHVPVMFSSLADALPQAQAGHVRLLALSGSKRAAQVPDVPTVAEAGLKGYESSQWYGVLAPAGTPEDILDAVACGIDMLDWRACHRAIEAGYAYARGRLAGLTDDERARLGRSDEG